MACRRCATPLERPGDHCLVCDTSNADAVVVDTASDRATITILHENTVVGTTTVATVPETDGRYARAHRRNLVGRIADTIRRKRPATVYATGDREVVASLRAAVRQEVSRVPADAPVEAALDGGPETSPDVVDRPAAAKLGGSHSTVIGGRRGRRALRVVADHPHVKKIVPGPIDASGNGARGGLTAKVTRSDPNGNVRLLLRDGSTVQETRVITTASDRTTADRIRNDLDEALEEASFAPR